MCNVYIYYVYINTVQTYSIYFENIYMQLHVFLYSYNLHYI